MSGLIRLSDMIPPGRIIDLKSLTKREALAELAALFAGDPRMINPAVFLDAIYRREALVSTGVGLGVAIPHVKIPEVSDYVIAVGRRRAGLEFDSLDNQPVRLIFMIGAAESQRGDFVRVLARVMKLLKDGANRVALLEAETPEAFLDVIRADDAAAERRP